MSWLEWYSWKDGQLPLQCVKLTCSLAGPAGLVNKFNAFMLRVQEMTALYGIYLFNFHGGVNFITFALTRSSVSTTSLV